MKAALDLVSRTNTSFFLTGKAGTGKTTFIRNILASVSKHFIILAPTGIAALSAGGQTIHHYFGMQLGVLGPNDLGYTRRENIKELRESINSIIIDEVSMVRCDLMDAIDRTLRSIMRTTTTFGGFQMIFVGDLYQLDPVVTDADREILRGLYDTEEYHFFNARCMDFISLPKIELSRMYRQRDSEFVEILGRIREGCQEVWDMNTVNSRLDPYREDDDFTVTLTSLNRDAARLNERKLAELPGESRIFLARYEGDCDSIRDVVDERIELKVGARVMFLKNDNDGRWANGTVGNVTELSEKAVAVLLENGLSLVVEPVKWPVVRQEYNKAKRRTENREIGAISQLPLRLAWGVTIHKSQSMTFERLKIDMGRGAFCCGQAYVALSRARSLKGITLNRELHDEDILVSPGVRDFSVGNNDNESVDLELSIADAIDESLRHMDFDSAAQTLLEMSLDAAREGNQRRASEFLRRFFITVVNDRSVTLFFAAEGWNECFRSTPEFGPTFLFYGGSPDAALAMMDEDPEEYDDIDMLYIRLRCYEAIGDETRFSELAEDLLVELSDFINEGLPACIFRKILYTIATNWRITGIKLALKCIDSLLEDIYIYKPLFSLIRSIAHSDNSLYLHLCKDNRVMPEAITKWDKQKYLDYLDDECEPYVWIDRFDPFFKHPFLDLAESLFHFWSNLT